VLETVEGWQGEHDVGVVRLFHNRPDAGGGYRPVEVQLLPPDLQGLQGAGERRWPSRRLPCFTMERGRLLSALLRQYFFVTLFRACAESLAAEHASRLAAMQSAERNLDERLEAVAARYRRARQDAITAELLDVVAGFEAITSGSGGQ
jgi:F-type H+-transporting ATPase subunit gamma